MKRFALIAAAIAAAAIFACNAPAAAQSNRTFVSGQGADTGGCAITAPCRSFSYAITQTNAGGEIVVLTSAGYGTVTINKAISISNQEGVEAAITVTSGESGITVAAGPSDVVNLRGLTVINQGSGGVGIYFTSGGTLNIQNTVITGFATNLSGAGLDLTPSGSSLINVSDTILANNFVGLTLSPTGSDATVQAFFERVQALGNTEGFVVDGANAASSTTVKATAADCVASGNRAPGYFGFSVSSFTGGAPTTFMVVSGKSVYNDVGLGVGSALATMFAAETTTSGNTTYGFLIIGGSLKSFGNNYITETINFGTSSPIPKQ
jgi:hypothetical protein